MSVHKGANDEGVDEVHGVGALSEYLACSAEKQTVGFRISAWKQMVGTHGSRLILFVRFYNLGGECFVYIVYNFVILVELCFNASF